MTGQRPLRIAIVAGEESGDLLGADLAVALAKTSGQIPELMGVGGHNLKKQGLTALFEADEIALMGISAVVRNLPRLIRRIGQTARAIVAAKPDCLITVDSPDFNLRVARKVRAADPSIPIVHYVCPSVWAWRPGRAAAMRPYVDHVLCLLPFEPAELTRLGGPPGTFVGHRLTQNPGVQAAAKVQLARRHRGNPHKLLVLPGSRRGEVRSLLEPFGKVVEVLKERGEAFELLLPTVPHVESLLRQATAGWAVRPEIIVDEQRKWQVFGEADAAIACSGTVTLELALCRVPFAPCYKTDPAARLFMPLIKVWSASLPNLIADWPVVPEYFNEFIRSGHVARQIAQLWRDTPARAAQLAGFAEVARALETVRPSGEIAADVVLGLLGKAQ